MIPSSSAVTPRPFNDLLDYNERTYTFKCYLKSKAFSYRCKNHCTMKCPFLLTIPINEQTYSDGDYKCIGIQGAYQASNQAHSEKCDRYYSRIKENSESIRTNSAQETSNDTFAVWTSDIDVLRSYIRHNLTAIPTSIQNVMKTQKQNFSINIIAEEKKAILNEMYPKEIEIAFHPSNCQLISKQRTSANNLYRFQGQVFVNCKKTDTFDIHKYYIFASRAILFQLSLNVQWFIDGTFSVAPSGFQQLLIIMVYIPIYKIFFPACYVQMTGKSQKLYTSAFHSLVGVAKEEGFNLHPTLIMMDFEPGMRNAAKETFNLSENGILGCYFHYTKALIKKAYNLGIMKRKEENTTAKVLIGLLKLLCHCPSESRSKLFEQIESIYKEKGAKYKKFLRYFQRLLAQKIIFRGIISVLSE